MRMHRFLPSYTNIHVAATSDALNTDIHDLLIMLYEQWKEMPRSPICTRESQSTRYLVS